MANKPLLLYSYFRSSCAYRVRIALHLKGLPYNIVPVHLLKEGGLQHSPQYISLNPSRQVPTLVDGETIIGQSMAILEYLEEEFPNPPLLPRQKNDRAIVRQMCEIINSGIQPLQNLSVSQFLDNEFKISPEDKNKWFQRWIHQGLKSLEDLLKVHSERYCFGDQITLADCLLVPQIFSAQRFKIDLSNYPRCTEINERCLKLTDFIRASPERQPDFEP
jgi:maleylacetoacetate isomerase